MTKPSPTLPTPAELKRMATILRWTDSIDLTFADKLDALASSLDLSPGFRAWRQQEAEQRNIEPKDEQVERLAEDLRDLTAPEYIDGKPSGTAFDHTLMDAADLLESLYAEQKNLEHDITSYIEINSDLHTQIATLTAERDQLKDALDMATQGKYSALMLELADGRAEQIHAGIQVCTLRGDIESLTTERDRAVEALKQILDADPSSSQMAKIARAALADSLQPASPTLTEDK